MICVTRKDTLNIDRVWFLLLNTLLSPTLCGSVLVVLLPLKSRFCIVFFLVELAWLMYHLNKRYSCRHNSSDMRGKKNFVITGGSDGLGLSIVKSLLKETHDFTLGEVFVLDIKPSKEEELHKNVKYIFCNVSKEDQVLEAFRLVEKSLPSGELINVLIHNAGKRVDGCVSKLTTPTMTESLCTNFMSQFWLTKLVLEHNSQVHIISIASLLGIIAPRNLSAYSCAKGAVIQFMESLAHESNAKVSIFLPGQLDTFMFQDVKVQQSFLAPLIDHRLLSKRIVAAVNDCEVGTFIYPLYGYMIPILRALPYALQEYLRLFSKVDKQIK